MSKKEKNTGKKRQVRNKARDMIADYYNTNRNTTGKTEDARRKKALRQRDSGIFRATKRCISPSSS